MSIYYFLISDKSTKREVGNYINASKGTIQDFTNVKIKAQELLNQSDNFKQNRKYKIILDNHCLYYYLSISDTFYLTAVPKTSVLFKKEYLLYELIKDIEHQGLRKLVDNNDELTIIGNQYLKYSITKYQNNNPELPSPAPEQYHSISSINSSHISQSNSNNYERISSTVSEHKSKPESIELHDQSDVSEKEEVIQTRNRALTTPINLTSDYVENYPKTLIYIKIAKALIIFVTSIVGIISFYYVLSMK